MAMDKSQLLASRERQAARVGQVSFYHQAQIVAPGLKVACVCAQWRSRSSTTQARYMPVLSSSARASSVIGFALRLCSAALARAHAHTAMVLDTYAQRPYSRPSCFDDGSGIQVAKTDSLRSAFASNRSARRAMISPR